MFSKRHEDVVRAFEVRLTAYDYRIQESLFRSLFKDRCKKCNLPSYTEIGSNSVIDLPRLTRDVGLACGFWLARRDFADALCAEFERQFELRTVSDDGCFLILKNVLIPDDPVYEEGGDRDLTFFEDKEKNCSLCGKPYILLYKGFRNFKAGNRIRPRAVYETSLKFGTADVKYPLYFCDEEAAYTLRALSRQFKFVRREIKFSEDAT